MELKNELIYLNSMFKHYIFTRFNLLDDKTDIYNNFKIEDPEAWMEHRIKLFDRTLPAMLSQTNQNFTWLLAFSIKTPVEIIEKYEHIHNIRVIYEYPKTWMKKVHPDADCLITSRLDNDDFYHPDFINTIQTYVNHTWLINKPKILDIDYDQLDLATGLIYSSNRITPNSPFLSLMEPWGDDLKTCFHCSHTKMPDQFKAFKIRERLATMVIHDKNQSNKIVGDIIT